MQLFTVSAVTLGPGEPDPFEHVAAVLVNVTRLQRGRELLLQPGRGLLQVRLARGRCISTDCPLRCLLRREEPQLLLPGLAPSRLRLGSHTESPRPASPLLDFGQSEGRLQRWIEGLAR